MTSKELNQYRALCREIAELERRINREQATDIVTGSQNCYPYIGRKFTISGVNTKSEAKLKLMKQRCCREKEEILTYIDSIDDSLVRQIFRYRHLDGLSWQSIAFRVGGGNTKDSVRKVHDRYLKKN